MFVFFVVIASGVWGLSGCSRFYRRSCSKTVPAETIYSQIDRVLAQSTEEARTNRAGHVRTRGIGDGTPRRDRAADPQKGIRRRRAPVRSVGYPFRASCSRRGLKSTACRESEALMEFFEGEVVPYVRGTERRASPHERPQSKPNWRSPTSGPG